VRTAATNHRGEMTMPGNAVIALPSREAVLALGEVLDLSLRERNRLLEAAGYAHIFRETPLSAHQMAHMRGVLQFILDRHLPYAAIAVDRHWNLLLANQ